MAENTAGNCIDKNNAEWNLEDFLTLATTQTPQNYDNLTAKYGDLLDDPDLTNEQREEALQILWNFVVTLLDFNFGIHSIQLAKATCGEEPESKDNRAFQGRDVVKSNNSKIANTFTQCAKKTKRRHEHDIQTAP